LQGGTWPRGSNDNRKFTPFLPHPLLQMLRLQHPTGQRRARNGRESAKQSPTLPELLFQRRGIEVQQGVIATETKKFTQDSALSRAVGVAS